MASYIGAFSDSYLGDRARFAGSGGTGSFGILEHDATVTADYTIGENKRVTQNAVATNLTINTGVSLTVPTGSVLTIV